MGGQLVVTCVVFAAVIGSVAFFCGATSEMNITGTLPFTGSLKQGHPSLSTQKQTRSNKTFCNLCNLTVYKLIKTLF